MWCEKAHSGSMVVTDRELKSCIKIDRPRPNAGWRVTWKKNALKDRSLNTLLDDFPHRKGGFATRKDGESYAKAILERAKRESLVWNDLDESTKQEVMLVASQIEFEGLKAVEAMRLGAEELRGRGEGSETPIGEYWSAYYKAHTGKNPKWKVKHRDQLKKFYELEEDGFFSEPIYSFQDRERGRKVVREVIRRHKKVWKAHNTVRQRVSRMRAFLEWIEKQEGMANLLKSEVILSICDTGAVVPEDLAKERDNYAATPEQGRSILQWAEQSKLKVCGFAVFKHFTGARTVQLCEEWTWRIVDWKLERITIPKNLAKKQKGYAYDFEYIPNLKEWLRWAWENDGKPEADKPIVPHTKETVTDHLSKWVNSSTEHRDIFRYPDANGKMPHLNKEIVLGKTHRNFVRSAFISYGNQLINDGGYGITKEQIQLVAEDNESWNSYLDSRATSKLGAEWFGMKPDDRFAKLESKNAVLN
jgi:hypothetical protein